LVGNYKREKCILLYKYISYCQFIVLKNVNKYIFNSYWPTPNSWDRGEQEEEEDIFNFYLYNLVLCYNNIFLFCTSIDFILFVIVIFIEKIDLNKYNFYLFYPISVPN